MWVSAIRKPDDVIQRIQLILDGGEHARCIKVECFTVGLIKESGKRLDGNNVRSGRHPLMHSIYEIIVHVTCCDSRYRCSVIADWFDPEGKASTREKHKRFADGDVNSCRRIVVQAIGA